MPVSRSAEAIFNEAGKEVSPVCLEILSNLNRKWFNKRRTSVFWSSNFTNIAEPDNNEGTVFTANAALIASRGESEKKTNNCKTRN